MVGVGLQLCVVTAAWWEASCCHSQLLGMRLLSVSACLRASVCAAQAHMHASSVFDEGAESMSVKLTMKRMQGYMPPRKAGKLNLALVSRLKLLSKAAKACWLLLACSI